LNANSRYTKSVGDYCRILGVDSRVTSKELKKAYRGLVKKWHPDQFLNDPNRLKNAKEKLQEVNEAYHALQFLISDPKIHLSQPSSKSSQHTHAAHVKANDSGVKSAKSSSVSFIDLCFAPWRKQVGFLRRVLIEIGKDPWIITIFILMLILAIAVDWFYKVN